ncbi:MAG: hypothetical protein RR478_00120 [Bacilli bacterium]
MKKIFKLIIGVVILIILSYGIYVFFIDCKETKVDFGKTFTLERFDYAKIGDEAIVKVLKIVDNRCKDKSCKVDGQYEVKLIVMNDRRMKFVELGSLSKSEMELGKLKYIVKLKEVDDGKNATLVLEKMEESK